MQETVHLKGHYSSVCSSARHDHRVSVSAGVPQNVTFTAMKQSGNVDVTGSWRNGIYSKRCVSAVMNYVVFLFCGPVSIYTIRIGKEAGAYLGIVTDHTGSNLLSTSIFKNADYFPSVWTVTANYGENVLLTMSSTKPKPENASWFVGERKITKENNDRIPQYAESRVAAPQNYLSKTCQFCRKLGHFARDCRSKKQWLDGKHAYNGSEPEPLVESMIPKLFIPLQIGDEVEELLLNTGAAWYRHSNELQIKNVQLKDSGLYTYGHRTKTGSSKVGIVRLIVRACPKDKFGPNCERTCPNCMNGGVCHDLSGQCICPPGFQGDTCDIACGDDRIGQFCTGTCSSTGPPDGNKSCAGVNICLPDPYGCSCGVGFKGLDCTQQKVLDITSVHRDYLLENGRNHKQSCFVYDDALNKEITFREFPRNRVKPPANLPIIRPESVGLNGGQLYEYEWKETKFGGGFICSVDGRPASTITSMTLNAKAKIFPHYLTKTVNKGDNVTIEMDFPDDSDRVAWHFNEQDLVGYGHELKLENVQSSQTGLYSKNSWTDANHYRGVFRLIVRKCTAARYGITCEHECPKCENGGICHDLTGQCICSPGFMGNICETGCGNDYIGRDCTGTCSSSGPKNGPKTCESVLVCLPDPYGCSCGAGFKGLNCSEACEIGTYGAGCTQKRECHCKDTGHCNTVTGHCEHQECENGWIGRPFCDRMSPVLGYPPKVSNISDTSAIVTWKEWDPKTGDLGFGEAIDYILQYKTSSQLNWQHSKTINLNNYRIYEANIQPLLPSTTYQIRVLVKEESGAVQQNSAYSSNFTTECSVPVPQNVKIEENKTGTIQISWQVGTVVKHHIWRGSGSSKLGRLEQTSRDWMPHNNGNGGIYKSTSDTVQGKMLTSSNDVSIKNYPEPYRPGPELWKCEDWKEKFVVHLTQENSTQIISTLVNSVIFTTKPYSLWNIKVLGSERSKENETVHSIYRSKQSGKLQGMGVDIAVLKVKQKVSVNVGIIERTKLDEMS
ncbi:Angiopoietin-1 receptor [Nymphon striatum]|nr:Angiopoietin-1 receptor [Nymphon striatum]